MLASIRRARARRTPTGLEPDRLAAVQAYTLRPPHPWPLSTEQTAALEGMAGLEPDTAARILEHERAVAAAIRRGFAGPELDREAA